MKVETNSLQRDKKKLITERGRQEGGGDKHTNAEYKYKQWHHSLQNFLCLSSQLLRSLRWDLGKVGEVISTAVVLPCTSYHSHYHTGLLARCLQSMLHLFVHLYRHIMWGGHARVNTEKMVKGYFQRRSFLNKPHN